MVPVLALLFAVSKAQEFSPNPSAEYLLEKIGYPGGSRPIEGVDPAWECKWRELAAVYAVGWLSIPVTLGSFDNIAMFRCKYNLGSTTQNVQNYLTLFN